MEVCPNRANHTYRVLPSSLKLPKLSCRDGALTVAGEAIFNIGQTRQIIHLHDLCNECGNCATFCVHQGKPYQEKPRLFLEASSFRRESDNAFYLEKADKAWIIRRREGGQESQLTMGSDAAVMTFENDLLRIVLSTADFGIKQMELKKRFEMEVSLAAAAEMLAILRGTITSLAFLPM